MDRVQQDCDIVNHKLRDANPRLELPQRFSEVNLLTDGNYLVVIERYQSIPSGEVRHHIVYIDKKDIPQVIEFLHKIATRE